MDDPVGEVLLLVSCERSRGTRPLTHGHGKLRDEERCALERTQPSDELEQVLPYVLEFREDFEGVEGIKGQEAEVERPSHPLRVQLEEVHPRLSARIREPFPEC